METKKKILVMRHGPSIHAVFKIIVNAGRLRLVTKVMKMMGGDCQWEVFTAPEWDTAATAKDIAELVNTETIIHPSLSDDSEAPALESFAAQLLATTDPAIIVTHFKRMNAVIAAIETATGAKIKIDEVRMRHLNRAYLVDLAENQALVIKEKS